MAISKGVLLIDGSYLFNGARSLLPRKLGVSSPGIKKFLEIIESKTCRISDIYYFDATPEPPFDTQRAFYQRLRENYVRVELSRLKTMDVKCYSCGNNTKRIVQAGVDVALATKMLSLTCEGQLDTLILLAGDGDFVEAIKYLRDVQHKHVYIVGYQNSVSQNLKECANRGCVIYLDHIWDEISYLPILNKPAHGAQYIKELGEVIALYDYEPVYDLDIAIRSGDRLLVLKPPLDNIWDSNLWMYCASVDGSQGYVPINYVVHANSSHSYHTRHNGI